MYKRIIMSNTTINQNESVEGEPIEIRIERILENGEGVSDASPVIHQERGDGVQPEYDIRTDRFDLALDGQDYINKSIMGKREEKAESQRQEREKALNAQKTEGKEGGAQSTQGQDTK